MGSNPFAVDPWQVAMQHYDRQLVLHIAAIMKAAGLTQIDVPSDLFLTSNDVVDISEHPEGRFYRIKGTFEVATDRTGHD